MQPPAPNSTNLILSQDAKVGDLYLKEGDEFMVNFEALHFNASQWPNPYEFIPERFDASSPYFLTSTG